MVGVHLVGGVLGALLIGLLGSAAFNSAAAKGLFYGGGLGLLGKQAAAVGASVTYSFVATLIIAWVVGKAFGGLRVSEEAEVEGLDINLHAETAYETLTGGAGLRTSAVTAPAPKAGAEVSA